MLYCKVMHNLAYFYNNWDISISIHDLEGISNDNVMTTDSVTTTQTMLLFIPWIHKSAVVMSLTIS